jgi:hypothetical protein
VHAVITRPPRGHWRILAGPFTYVSEAHDVARRVAAATPPGAAIVATCPWAQELEPERNIDAARLAGAIERVT